MGRKIKDTRMFNTDPVIEQAVDEYFDDKPGTDVIPAEKAKRGRPKKDPAINGIDPAAAKALDKATKKREEIVVNTPLVAKPTLEFVKAKPIEKPAHAQFGSPSGLYVIAKCPAKIAFGKDIPEPGESEFAKEGTVFHDYMYKCTPAYLQNDHKKVSKILADCTEYEGMSDHVWDTLAKVGDIWNRFREKHAKCEHHFELKVKLNDDVFGTADVVFTGMNIKTGTTSIIAIDYKYGLGVYVSAHENLQGIAYLLAAAKTLNLTNIGVGLIIIAQVRLNQEWEKEQYIVKGAEFPKWEKEIQSIVAHAKDIYKGAEAIEGNLHAGDHCRFCKAQSVCPARKEATFDAVTLTASNVEEAVKKLTLDEQVAIFKKKSHIEDFLKAVASNLHQAFVSGVEHPDLKLIRTNGRRKWKEEEDDIIVKELIRAGIVEPWTKKPIPLTQAERELGREKNKIAHLMELGEGKIELVEASDKRPPLQIAQAQELPA